MAAPRFVKDGLVHLFDRARRAFVGEAAEDALGSGWGECRGELDQDAGGSLFDEESGSGAPAEGAAAMGRMT